MSRGRSRTADCEFEGMEKRSIEAAMNEVIEPVAVVQTLFPCRGRTSPGHLDRWVRVTL